MKTTDILITKMMFAAVHALDSGPITWSVYLSSETKPVLNGGCYPDENPKSTLVLDKLTGEQADNFATGIGEFFAKLGVGCLVEEIAD